MLIETHHSDKTTFEEYYGLPEEDGRELIDYCITPLFTSLNYRCGTENIAFSQQIIYEGNMGNISTDKAEVEPLSLYEENAGFIMNFGNNGTLIYWVYDGYLLLFAGNINKNTAIKLVYSTKIVELSKKLKKPVTIRCSISL